MTRSKTKKTAAERLRLLQDELLRAEMAGDEDTDDLKFRIEQARIDAEVEKMQGDAGDSILQRD